MSHCSVEHRPFPCILQEARATNPMLRSRGTAMATSPSVLEPQRCLQAPSPNSSSSKRPQDKPQITEVSTPTSSSACCSPLFFMQQFRREDHEAEKRSERTLVKGGLPLLWKTPFIVF